MASLLQDMFSMHRADICIRMTISQWHTIRDIKDYISEIQVIQDDKAVAEKDIEVNHPLHYGGYHFYQQGYDDQEGKYTILRVTSDSGLFFVYTGYFLLCLGTCWHFWFNKLRTKGA